MTKRIMLVEDESSLHDLLKLNLELDGNKVVGVKDGETAIKKFNDQQFDLVILDVMIPGINGLIPVVFVAVVCTLTMALAVACGSIEPLML